VTAALAKTAEEALVRLRAAAPKNVELELYLSRSEERSIDLRDGRLDGVQSAASEGAGLRVIGAGRMAFAAAGQASVDAAMALLPRALEQLPHVEADDKRALPVPPKAADDAELSRSLWDEKLFTTSWDVIRPRLEELSARVRKADKRVASVLRAGYSESRG